jgi:hypothetical protein
MKKTIAAITAGLLLVAGQAVAQNDSATVRVGDRIGAQAEESSEFLGLPIPLLVLGTALVIWGIVELTDDSESD